MQRSSVNILISILLLAPIAGGILGSYGKAPLAQVFFKKPYPSASLEKEPCDMDECYPHSPKCPLCSSSPSIFQYVVQEIDSYLPIPTPSLLKLSTDTFSEQEFVTSVFRPPTIR
jgi:hypothetical protein